MRTSFIASAMALLGFAAAAPAQSFYGGHAEYVHLSAAELVQRNVEQARHIEEGLRMGQLHTREAGELQGRQARILRIQAEAMSDGFIDVHERVRIAMAQDELAHDIGAARHDADRGWRFSPSVERVAVDVQRGIEQQRRIEQGLRSGELNLREAARLQFAQAGITEREALAARDGYVTPQEQAGVQRARDVQGERISEERRDAR